jgi:hypothetical protein
MNLALFKKHTASRKPVCKPLAPGELAVDFPKDIGEANAKELCMISGEVIFADFDSHNQYVRLRADASLELIHSWSGYLPPNNDIRLSRFKTGFRGMPALELRVWEEKDGKYVRYKTELRNGDKVKCAAVPVTSKGKIYTNLGRDILLLQKCNRKKRKTVVKTAVYFSDEEA